MISYKTLITVIFISFFFFGAYKIATDDQISNEIKNMIIEQSPDHPIATILFVKSLDDITPSLSYKLPFTDKKIFLINDFPLFGYSHALFILFLFCISGFLMSFFGVHKKYQILTFILLFFIGYLLMSLILYVTYFKSAEIIGFTKDQAINFRDNYNNNFDNVILPLIFSATIGILGIIKTFFIKVKNAKS